MSNVESILHRLWTTDPLPGSAKLDDQDNITRKEAWRVLQRYIEEREYPCLLERLKP